MSSVLGNLSSGFLIRSDTNRTEQPQKIVGGLKFPILVVFQKIHSRDLKTQQFISWPIFMQYR